MRRNARFGFLPFILAACVGEPSGGVGRAVGVVSEPNEVLLTSHAVEAPKPKPRLRSFADASVATPEAEDAGVIVGTLPNDNVSYSCDAVGAPSRQPKLHPVAAALLNGAHLHDPKLREANEGLALLVERAHALPNEAFTSRERVLIQAAAIKIWRAGSERAGELARRVALDSSELSLLDTSPEADLLPVLGPAHKWVERRGDACGSSAVHDRVFNGLLSFRPVRSGSMRALIAQVVAFDDTGHPAVTPFVASVELRTSMRADSPACVLELTGDGLTVMDYPDLEPTRFIEPLSNGTLSCGRCHMGDSPFDLRDLRGEEALSFRYERRQSLLSLAGSTGSALFP